MQEFGTIFLMSFVVISLYDIIKGFYTNNKVDVNAIVTAIIGIFIAIIAQLDIFKIMNINLIIPYAGQVMTGLVISKGSNYVYDFVTKILSLISGKLEVSETTETTETAE